MISAFGVEHNISKAQKKKDYSTEVTAGGAALGGTAAAAPVANKGKAAGVGNIIGGEISSHSNAAYRRGLKIKNKIAGKAVGSYYHRRTGEVGELMLRHKVATGRGVLGTAGAVAGAGGSYAGYQSLRGKKKVNQ